MSGRVFILGAGAIGIALAARLIQNKRDATLVRTSRDDIDEYEEIVALTDSKNETYEMPVRMVSLDKLEQLDGIIVVATKTYANKLLAKKLSHKNIHAPIVIMQNGIGIEQPYLDAGLPEVYRCVLFSASQKLDEFSIRHTPIVPSPIGIIEGNERTLKRIVATLNTPNFQFSFEENIEKVIWQKAIINSVYNTICPFLEIDNGIFHRNEEAMTLAEGIMKECMNVASSVGVNLDLEKLKQRTLAISKASDGQNISTLEDIKHQRETEIDALNLEIVRIADNQTPRIFVEKTKLLGEMLLLKSKISRGVN